MYKDKIEGIINKVVNAFSGIAGINAVVLGGSRATGTANEHSDIDIGIYYDESSFDIESLKVKACAIDDERRSGVITNLGEWGPWINGGGWLKVDGVEVDILFRSTKKVISVINECISGNISIYYQCGHPFGFVNSIYMGEIAYCKILSSTNDIIYKEKSRIEKFPETYRKAAIKKFLWEYEFSDSTGRIAIVKKDIVYAAGSLFRCAVCLLQVLYAVNGMYILNEKGSLNRLLKQKNSYIPENFASDIESAFSDLNLDTMEESFNKIHNQYDLIRK